MRYRQALEPVSLPHFQGEVANPVQQYADLSSSYYDHACVGSFNT